VVLVLLAWVFIGGQGLLAAGSVYNYHSTATNEKGELVQSALAWGLLSQGANRMRVVATQAQPEVIGNVAIYLGVVNVLGLAAFALGLLSWSRSKHTSGKLTIAVAVAVVLINSLLNLPYA
ncbi:MAG: hypothetical protein JW993_07560, partial [Sedimentisphaerales bacterium]|nr:hypothetical protein [Sedimentisphaerales bacterium]